MTGRLTGAQAVAFQRVVRATSAPEMSQILLVSLFVLDTTQTLFSHAIVLTIDPPANADGQNTISAPAERSLRQSQGHSMS